jgi:glyoxylase-like metal-dependent hydrolase (beta-lactamase superfamily II)
MPPDSPRLFTGGYFFTNGWLLTGTEGNIAVDAPDGMAEWLAGQGVKVGALLLTHWHLDHVADAARLVREHGCKVFAWGPSTPELRLETHLKTWAGISWPVEDYPVDVALAGLFEEDCAGGTDGEGGKGAAGKKREIFVAGRTFRLEHVPGHSPDSVVFIEETAGLIFSGDTLMQGGIGRSDFPGGDGELLERGIAEKILPLPGAWELLSGHGRRSTLEVERRTNPFLR